MTVRRQSWLVGQWATGARLFRWLGYVDHFYSAASWQQALEWLCNIEPARLIGEIQFWCHGKWGFVMIGEEKLTLRVFGPSHPLRAALERLVSRFLPDSRSVIWFRSCATFGARDGLQFAKYWAKFMRCRVAGFTHEIWLFQSGLHVVTAGHEPDWSPEEGLRSGTPDAPNRARWSRLGLPRTITCFHPTLPDLRN